MIIIKVFGKIQGRKRVVIASARWFVGSSASQRAGVSARRRIGESVASGRYLGLPRGTVYSSFRVLLRLKNLRERKNKREEASVNGSFSYREGDRGKEGSDLKTA